MLLNINVFNLNFKHKIKVLKKFGNVCIIILTLIVFFLKKLYN